jgi:hypothetical protein
VDIADIRGESLLLTLTSLELTIQRPSQHLCGTAALGCALLAFGSWLLADYQLQEPPFQQTLDSPALSLLPLV